MFGIMASYLLACYGGGLPQCPHLRADTLGPVILAGSTAHCFTARVAQVVASPLIFARVKEATQNPKGPFYSGRDADRGSFIITVLYKTEWP